MATKSRKRAAPRSESRNLDVCRRHMHPHGPGGIIYGLGFIGALVYYLTTATSITMGLVGILKALFWPAFLVFQLMKFLGM
jgi:hypothetical protein